MRILFLATDAFGGHGGIAKYCRDLLTAISSHSLVGEIVAIPRIAPRTIQGVPPNVRYVTSGLNGQLRFAQAVLGELRRLPECQLVICAHVHLLPLSLMAAVQFRAPIALMAYGIEVWQPTRRNLTGALCRYVDHVVSISDTTLKRFTAWAPLRGCRLHVLPNAFDQRLLTPGPKPDRLLDRYQVRNRVVLMTFGRMPGADRHKGFDEVIELLPHLQIELPNVVYLLVGDGPDRSRLEQKARALGVSQRVIFAGEVSEEEKADHFRLADAYVMPSRGEGFGFVLLEAMACGIPTIGSRVDGGREAMCDGALGAIVDPSNQTELLQAVLRAVRIRERRVPIGLEYFSFDNFEARAHAFLNSVLTSRVEGPDCVRVAPPIQ